MSVPEICGLCGKGHYSFGSGLYAYYDCGHSYAKPLSDDEKGYFSTFNPYKDRWRIKKNNDKS